MTNLIKLNFSCVYTIPNENLHKVMAYLADSSNTNSGGKSTQPW